MPQPFCLRAFERWLAGNRHRFRHPPRITLRRKTHIDIAFRGITPKITGCITRTGASIAVKHEGECVDLLIDFDITERRNGDGRYFCGLCTESVAYASRQALWENHCFEPLLQWVNQELRAGQWLHLHILDSGASWAALGPQEPTTMDRPHVYMEAWPVISETHGKKNDATLITNSSRKIMNNT